MRTFARYLAITFISTAAGILLVLVLAGKSLHHIADAAAEREAGEIWHLLAHSIEEKNDTRILRKLFRTLSEKSGTFATLIDEDGHILIDTSGEFEEGSKIQNPEEFPEIFDSYYGKTGRSTRIHPGSGKTMLFLARRLSSGWVLRVLTDYSLPELVSRRHTRTIFLSLLYLAISSIGITWFFLSKIRLATGAINRISENLAAGRFHIHFPKFRDPLMDEITFPSKKIHSHMKREIERLKSELSFLENVTHHLNEGILLLDHDDRVFFSNRKAEEIFECELKKGENILSLVSDPDLILFAREVTSSTGEKYSVKSMRGRTYDVYVKKLDDSKLVVMRDTTEKHIYEEFKTELVGNITHELKTPLSLMMGYAETLLNTPDLDEETRKNFLEAILRSSTRLNNLINDMLELHRLESTNKDFRVKTPTYLEELKRTILETFEGSSDKEIKIETQPDEVYILYDHLMSILVNLIDNAVKYSEGKTVKATIRKDEDWVTVEVMDEGPRIPEEKRDLIFKRFYTLSRSRSRKKSGTGLGLSIVKHVCALYEGAITHSYNDLGGNTFTATLREKKKA